MYFISGYIITLIDKDLWLKILSNINKKFISIKFNDKSLCNKRYNKSEYAITFIYVLEDINRNRINKCEIYWG